MKRPYLFLIIVLSFVLGGFTQYAYNTHISTTDVWHASKLLNLDFSHTEIDSMVNGLERLTDDYAANREIKIPYEVAPALSFNPLPAGFEVPKKQEPILYSEPQNVQLPTNREELAFYTVRQLAVLLQTKQITSEELTQFFIQRLKTYDDTLACVITITEEAALAQARQADRDIQTGNYKGLLHGIPYGAKDLFATKQYKTSWGAMPYKDQSFDYDATVIKKLEEAGAVLVAKMTLGALAMGDVWYGGKTRNPWNPETGSSGSSAGSASAVSAGLLPFALGTETLGSIVSPSTVCGTTGLRPTFGRVSRYGAMALSWTMDKVGPICRSAEDCAIVFDAIRGADGLDQDVMEAPFNYTANFDPKTLKIGYLKSAFERDYAFKKNDSLTLRKLEAMGYTLIPIELPPMPNIRFILTAEAAAAFDELTLNGDDDLLVRQQTYAWPNLFRTARFVPAVEYIKANRIRKMLIEDMASVFSEVDVYVHPSWASPSLRITNFTGHPCVVFPNGFQENGLPTSMSVTGQLFEEAHLLRLVEAFQSQTAFEEAHPAMVGFDQ